MLLDICKCIPNSEDLEQSSTVDICIGTSVNPCICNDTACRVSCMYVYTCTYASCHMPQQCNEGYAGNDTLCAKDSDRDNFPDVELDCDKPTCSVVCYNSIVNCLFVILCIGWLSLYCWRGGESLSTKW